MSIALPREDTVSDRFTVTIPDSIAEHLQHWAELEGRAKANLAAFIIETAVKNRFPDEYPPIQAPGTPPGKT
ncbi:MAG: hypothetical protein AAGD25_10190 [Cyanobacteria bacterium P01_F01_bin.150]